MKENNIRKAGSRMSGVGTAHLPAIVLLAMLVCAGCGKKDTRTVVMFWHTQSGPNGEVITNIIKGFNTSQDRYRVVGQYVGDYDSLFRKMIVSVRSRRNMPAIAVAYESMVARYHRAGAVVDLDSYLRDPECGLSNESLADIFPQFIETNRFKRYDGKLLSFPFTKSMLMMYHNKGMLAKLGFAGPPETWDDFVAMCRAVKEANKHLDPQNRRYGYALSLDASTIDAMVYSFGGNVVNADESASLLDSEPARKVYELIKMMSDEKLCYMIRTRSYDDRTDFANDRVAFFIRSSASRPVLEKQANDLKKEGKPHADWDLGIIPHAKGCKPVTVMFGANICMLKTTPEIQRGAWEFIKYFTSTNVTAQWATNTGYLPVRKSALETQALKDFFAASPRARRPLEVLPYSVGEPTVDGWQEVRLYIEKAEKAVIKGAEPAAAMTELAGRANRILAETTTGHAPPTPAWFNYLFILLIGGVGAGVWRLRRHLA